MRPSRYLKSPQQDRSRAAVDRVYVTVNELLEQKPFDQITIAEVAAKSSVSIGSIYNLFASKDSLLWVLYENYIVAATEAVAVFASDPAGESLEERVPLAVRAVAEIFARHRGIVRSLFFRFRQAPEEVPEHFHTQIKAVYDAIDAYFVSAGVTRKQATLGRHTCACTPVVNTYSSARWRASRGVAFQRGLLHSLEAQFSPSCGSRS